MKVLRVPLDKLLEALVDDGTERRASYRKLTTNTEVAHDLLCQEPEGDWQPPRLEGFTAEELTEHVVRWASRTQEALRRGQKQTFLLAFQMAQSAMAELSKELSDAKLEVVPLMFAPDEVDTREEPDLTGLDPAALRRHLKAKAKLERTGPISLTMQDVIDLFLGDVPTFEQLPACPVPDCAACEARKSYWAAYKAH